MSVSETGRLGVRLWKSRVLRGGSWNKVGENCRTGNRNANDPANRNRNIGFRVVWARSSVRESDDQGTDPAAFLSVGKRCRPAAKRTRESPVLVAEVDSSKANAPGFPFYVAGKKDYGKPVQSPGFCQDWGGCRDGVGHGAGMLRRRGLKR